MWNEWVPTKSFNAIFMLEKPRNTGAFFMERGGGIMWGSNSFKYTFPLHSFHRHLSGGRAHDTKLENLVHLLTSLYRSLAPPMVVKFTCTNSEEQHNFTFVSLHPKSINEERWASRQPTEERKSPWPPLRRGPILYQSSRGGAEVAASEKEAGTPPGWERKARNKHKPGKEKTRKYPKEITLYKQTLHPLN